MGKVYALSDIHGFYSIYEQVKEFLEPEDTVIFLGDAADRGPRGWECIKAILDDPQFTYIMGNHDLFLVRRFFGPHKEDNRWMHDNNGGQATIDNMVASGDSPQVISEYLEKLAAAPYYVECETDDGQHLYLSHSGAVTHLGNKELDGEDFTWDRHHFFKDAEEGIDLIIHGHTPIPYLIDELNEYSVFADESMIDGSKEFVAGQPFYYANWTKCDIDSCTVVSGAATLLDLETLEATAFFVKGWERDFLWKE